MLQFCAAAMLCCCCGATCSGMKGFANTDDNICVHFTASYAAGQVATRCPGDWADTLDGGPCEPFNPILNFSKRCSRVHHLCKR